MGWDTESDHYIDIANQLTQTYADYQISCRNRPRAFGDDPGPGELWAASTEQAREDFGAVCKRAVAAELWATQIAEAAGCTVEDIVYDLNEAGLQLPWTDDWPHWGDSQEAAECRATLRQFWRTLRDMAFALPYKDDASPHATTQREQYEGMTALFREECKKAARLGVAVRPILDAAGCTYDELLPHLLAIGYTQTYTREDGKRVTTISLAEPEKICTWCDLPAKHCACRS